MRFMRRIALLAGKCFEEPLVFPVAGIHEPVCLFSGVFLEERLELFGWGFFRPCCLGVTVKKKLQPK